METAQQKIKFSDLSFPIKVAIITGWIISFVWVSSFALGLWIGFFG